MNDKYYKSLEWLIVMYAFLLSIEHCFFESGSSIIKYFLAISILYGSLVIFIKKYVLTRMMLLSFVFAIYLLISFILGSFTEIRINTTVLILMNLFFVYLIMIMGINDNILNKIIIASVLGGVIASVVLLVNGQNLYGDFTQTRLALTEGNDPNFFSMRLLLPFMLSAGGVFKFGLKNKMFYISAMIIIGTAIIYTQSRGALLAILFVFFLHLMNKKQYFKVLLFSVIVGVSMLWLGNMYDRFSIDEIMQSGGGGRLAIWYVALDMIIDNFVFGVGIADFANNYNQYAIHTDVGFFAGAYRAPHNGLIEIISELGIVGFLLYFMIIVCSMKEASIEFKRKYIFFYYALYSMMIASFFLSTLRDKAIWFVLAIIASYHSSVRKT